ncbi:MAG: GH3 auxin-responsive promoter family protein [Crocinitomicaceae bacterium]
MIYIGKLIQQTTKAIIPVRRIRRPNALLSQKRVLTRLIRKAGFTELGFEYSFEKIIKPLTGVSMKEFQENVPISSYEEFNEKWIKKLLEGKRDITWPGKIKHFALSSGTTGSPSKRIPVSKQMIRSFQLASLVQFNVLYKEDFPVSFYKCQVLTIGGSTKLTKVGDYFEGDLSGILREHTALIARNVALPGSEITQLKDFHEKVAKMVEEAPNWDVGIVAGIPTWCVKVMEEIVRHHKLKSIHDIWPNLRVYVHGGVYLDPYVTRLDKLCKQPLLLLDTYLASEGYFAYQDIPSKKGMRLILNKGIFFEFIPFTKDFFDASGNVLQKHFALTVDQVELGVDYAIVITTNSGLWRYILGDLVQFVDTKEKRLVISGRIKQTLNLCGEHLTLDNLNEAVKQVCSELNLPHGDYTIISRQDEQFHEWYMEQQTGIEANKLMELIDRKICLLNDDYAYVRKHALNIPILNYVKKDAFYNYLNSQNKLGAQNKMPRVLNAEQKVLWENYINTNYLVL